MCTWDCRQKQGPFNLLVEISMAKKIIFHWFMAISSFTTTAEKGEFISSKRLKFRSIGGHIISVNYLMNILTCCGVCFLQSEILALMSLIKYYLVQLKLMHEVGCHSCFQNQRFTSRWLRPSFIDVCDSSQDREVSLCLLSEAHRRLTKSKLHQHWSVTALRLLLCNSQFKIA